MDTPIAELKTIRRTIEGTRECCEPLNGTEQVCFILLG